MPIAQKNYIELKNYPVLNISERSTI